MFNLKNVQIYIITSAKKHVLRELVEISMIGNNFSLDDEEKYRAAWDHFVKEFKSFDTEGEVFSIAEVDDRIIGFVRVRRKPSMPKQWWLMGLEVCEEYRRQGIGTMLIKAVMRGICSLRYLGIITCSQNQHCFVNCTSECRFSKSD